MADLKVNDPVHVNRKKELLEGIITFLGSVDFAEGDDWVGVRLTGPSVGLGKNDGSVQGRQYFHCPPSSGLFIKKASVSKRTLTRLEELRLRKEIDLLDGNDPTSRMMEVKSPQRSSNLTPPRSHVVTTTPRSKASLQSQINDLQSVVDTKNSEIQSLQAELRKVKEEGQYQTMNDHRSSNTVTAAESSDNVQDEGTERSPTLNLSSEENNGQVTGPSNSSSSWRRTLLLFAAPVLDEEGGAHSVAAGLFSLFLIGGAIGLAMPKNPDLPTKWYRTVSAGIGWIYFLCWSISFYPQVISNFKRRTTQGLSSDFCGLNILGFACYSVYNVAFFWSDTIRHLYKERHGPDAEITVQSNDVAFALHALLLSSITFLQIGYYNGIRAQRPSKSILAVLVVFLIVVVGYPCMVLINFGGNNVFNWLDYLYTLSTIKIMISLIKYIPQVILNYRRKSTVGWSIWNIILDFSGGLLSDIQLIFDCADLHDFSGITGNLAKFGLGFVSILFDIVFMLQHYVFYTGHADALNEREPLLADYENQENTENDQQQRENAA